jgi:hypothetical protein
MAAVAVLVRDRVTYLTGKVAQMLLVLGNTTCVCPDILMAVATTGGIRIFVPVNGYLTRTVKYVGVAIGAEHTLLAPVDVSR